MRSRYTAFVLGDMDHIDRTYAREKREEVRRQTGESLFESVEWVGLRIFGTSRGGDEDDTGTVDFAARFRKDGAMRVHRERSSFRREDGYWVYVDGEIAPDRPTKVGRNDPCPCGSGRKFKKCCGA
jgi:SEC-C motif-containing protein